MTKLLIVGAGGHSKVVIDIALEQGLDVVGCVSQSESAEYRGVQVFVGDAHLARFRSQGVSDIFVAVGNNRARSSLADDARALGFNLITLISRSAQVSPTAVIGEGALIMPHAVINADATVGRLAIINTGATVDHDCIIGDAAHIAPGVHFSGGVRVGDRTLVGVGSSARPSVVIGSDAVIGAGSVLVNDIADGVTAFGVPARQGFQPGSTHE